MAYGRIYIDNLKNKVTGIFNELQEEKRLCEHNFIDAFKREYPKDYAMLQYEWEFKVHEFKKNRKGNPKPHPIRPDKILSNMYRNYYFKLIKQPSIKKKKKKVLFQIISKAGQSGYKIRNIDNGKYNVINKETETVEDEAVSYRELKELFPLKAKGGKRDGKSQNK